MDGEIDRQTGCNIKDDILPVSSPRISDFPPFFAGVRFAPSNNFNILVRKPHTTKIHPFFLHEGKREGSTRTVVAGMRRRTYMVHVACSTGLHENVSNFVIPPRHGHRHSARNRAAMQNFGHHVCFTTDPPVACNVIPETNASETKKQALFT
jgi:hypothetical protein